jgi:hypothetical protein
MTNKAIKIVKLKLFSQLHLISVAPLAVDKVWPFDNSVNDDLIESE